ncbi:MAG: hypothetical protein GY940_44985, partial [bacterium]|nr:hypothetical protein [bacterium]
MTRFTLLGAFAAICLWGTLVFLAPVIVDYIVKKEAASMPSGYKIEYNKLTIITEFEERAVKESGKHSSNSPEGRKEVIEGYWNTDFPKVQKEEIQLKNKIKNVVEISNSLSRLTPTGLYTMAGNEASSMGYPSFLGFYDYLIKLRGLFLRFWFDEVYYNLSKKVKPFLKEGENIYKGGSVPPNIFNSGVLLNLFYILILAFLSVFLYTRRLYSIKKRDIQLLGTVDINIMDGSISPWLTKGGQFKNLIFTLFSGQYPRLRKNGFAGEFYIDGVNIASEKFAGSLCYIVSLDSVPGHRAVKTHVTRFAKQEKVPAQKLEEAAAGKELNAIWGKTFKELEPEDKFEITLALLKMKMGKKQVYLIDKICEGLHYDYSMRLKEQLDKLVSEGSTIIFLLSPSMVKGVRKLEGKCFYYADFWLYDLARDERERELEQLGKG